MSTVLIVSGSYYPYATANAVCVKKFEDKLRLKGHSVLYCNRKHDLYEPDHHSYEGTELYTVGKNSDLCFQTMDKLGHLDLPNHMGLCLKWSRQLFRAMMKLVNLGSNSVALRTRADKHYIDSYAKAVCDIVEKRDVDVILSVSMPFDSHRAVLEAFRLMEKRGVAKRPFWMAYCIDAFWSKAGIAASAVPSMKAEEKRVFAACDKILFLDTIRRDYAGGEYDSYRGKMAQLPLPIFDLNSLPEYQDGFESESGFQNWLFAGTIYDDFRNAEGLVNIIRGQKGRPVKIHLMGKFYPKSLEMLQEVRNEMPGQLVLYGRQSYEFAKGSMRRADVLINLANDDMRQIPSKIFEYMSCLKPVLNIYRLKEDVGTSYLTRYPLAFNLSSDNIEDQKDALNQWLGTLEERTITIEELRSIYHDMLSETVAEDFYSLIKPYLS